MRIQLDWELVGQLIEARGGVSHFLDRWHAVSPNADERLARATVYRWIKGESVPKNSHLFLRLAGLLDVDPFGLIAIPGGDILAAADDVLRIVQNAAMAPAWLRFVHGFFGRQKRWPPDELASTYFERPWCRREFSHDPGVRSNYYPTILLQQLPIASDGRPQVLHFAFKYPSLFNARWLEYGLVRVQAMSAVLYHINGHTDRLDRKTLDESVRVQTWFGPTDTLFRVASLHPFELSVGDGGHEPAMRFPGT